MSNQNPVDFAEVKQQIGDAGLDDLKHLRNCLINDRRHGIEQEEMTFRIAPSIVTRSEAEIFGLSVPRFAIRAYMGIGNTFVNLRRTATLCDQVRPWVRRAPQAPGKRRLKEIKEVKGGDPSLEVGKNISIADSVLRAPIDLQKTYHVIESDLGRVYGEGEETVGTPFINHIPLTGGGICAQAVSFMATTLMHKHVHHVYGMGEITYLAASKTIPGELALIGLNKWEIRNYLRSVGLSAEWQKISQYGDTAGTSSYGPIGRLTLALRAYLLSDFPIVFPCDLGRMYGIIRTEAPAIKPRAGTLRRGLKKRESPDIARNHTVLLVGCKKSSPKVGDELSFLLNDSFSFPFLEASAKQLWFMAHYDDFREGKLNPGWFLPTAPAEVKLRLCDSAPIKAGETLPWSLWQLSPIVLASCFGKYVRLPLYFGECRLLQVKRLDEARELPDDVKKYLRLQAKPILEGQLNGENWCWVQYIDGDGPKSVWVWNAETEFDDQRASFEELRDRYLLFGAHLKGERWTQIFATKTKTRKEDEKKYQLSRSPELKVDLSLLSSFCATGLDTLGDSWPSKLACELYAFMQGDAEAVLPLKVSLLYRFRRRMKYWKQLFRNRWRRKPKEADTLRDRLRVGVMPPMYNVVERMAAIAGTGHAAKLARQLVKRHVSKCESPIIGVSSFIPEIMSPVPERVRMAQRALIYLVELTHAIRNECKTATPFLEIVGGSRIYGCSLGEGNLASVDGTEPYIEGRNCKHGEVKETCMVANILGPEESIETLCNNLQPVAAAAIDHKILISMELEPGPLYIIRDRSTVDLFLNQIKKTSINGREGSRLSDVIGLNLDVGHWILAGLKPSDVSEVGNEGHIVHAHLSYQSKGHFSDIPVLTEKNLQEFCEAAELLEKAKLRTGFASFELEAARARNHVDVSIRQISRILAGKRGTNL